MPDTVTAAPPFDEQVLSAALRRLRHAEQEATAARSHATVAKEQLALALFDAAAGCRDAEVAPSQDLLDRLYWDVRDLRVNDIARAFGLAPAELKRRVTPRIATATCRACRRPTEIECATRSEPSYVQCDACRRDEEVRRERAWARDTLDREEAPFPHGDEPWPPMGPLGLVPDPVHLHDDICDICRPADGQASPTGRFGLEEDTL